MFLQLHVQKATPQRESPSSSYPARRPHTSPSKEALRLRLQWRRPSFDPSHDGDGSSPPPPSPSSSKTYATHSTPDDPTPSPHSTRDRPLLPAACPLSHPPSPMIRTPPPSEATIPGYYATSSQTRNSPGVLASSPEWQPSSRGTSRPSLIPAGGI